MLGVAEGDEDDEPPEWSESSEKTLRRWLKRRRMKPSLARLIAVAFHAMDFPEKDWVKTIDAMPATDSEELSAQKEQQRLWEIASKQPPDAEVELQLEMALPDDPAELVALQQQIREEMTFALGVDVAQLGEVELTAG